VAAFSVDAGANLESDTVTQTVYSAGPPAIMTITTPVANSFVVGETVEFLNTVTMPTTPLPTCITGIANTATVLSSGSSSFEVSGAGCSGAGTVNPSNAVVQGPVGYQVLNLRVGDPVFISGCTSITLLNGPMQTVSGHPPVAASVGPGATTASTAWNGTYSVGNVTVEYPWSKGIGTGSSDSSCTLTNIQGNPQSFNITHVTEVTDATATIGTGPSFAHGPNFQINHLFRDSIMLSGQDATNAAWYNPAVSVEGLPQPQPPSCPSTQCPYGTENFNYDSLSMTAYKLVWPGRTNTQYTEFGNAPGYTDPNGCTGATGCSPPTSTGSYVAMYFPANPYCSGSTYASSGSNCVAFTGAMSITPVVATIGATQIASDVLTIMASNSFMTGQYVVLSGTGESYLNGQEVLLTSASGSQFTANFSHANEMSTESGSCTVTNGVTSGPCATIPPMPLALADYHGYALRTDSPYHNAASDMTDIGAIITGTSGIDAAQTLNQYVCASTCGSPGPFPDVP
jgi:hypothetical protein